MVLRGAWSESQPALEPEAHGLRCLQDSQGNYNDCMLIQPVVVRFLQPCLCAQLTASNSALLVPTPTTSTCMQLDSRGGRGDACRGCDADGVYEHSRSNTGLPMVKSGGRAG
jgi:hypothetical protein